jgi:hypothetical protein
LMPDMIVDGNTPFVQPELQYSLPRQSACGRFARLSLAAYSAESIRTSGPPIQMNGKMELQRLPQ